MAAVRLGKDGALAAQDAHGRYQEAVFRGAVFTACNVAAQALTVALATTYTGLVIANPVGSGKNLVILSANFIQSAAPSSFAALFLIAGGSSTGILTHTTPLAAPGIQKALISGAAQYGTKGDDVHLLIERAASTFRIARFRPRPQSALRGCIWIPQWPCLSLSWERGVRHGARTGTIGGRSPRQQSGA